MPLRKTKINLPGVSLPQRHVPKEPPGWNRTELAIRQRAEAFTAQYREREPAGEPPEWWKVRYPGGTKPEWAVYWALLVLGKKPELDFIYQAIMLGLELSYYSTTDFLLPHDGIAIEVQGEYWHYGVGSEAQYHDILRFEALAKEGMQLIFIDEEDALERPIWIVREALAGRDHSKLKMRI